MMMMMKRTRETLTFCHRTGTGTASAGANDGSLDWHIGVFRSFCVRCSRIGGARTHYASATGTHDGQGWQCTSSQSYIREHL